MGLTRVGYVSFLAVLPSRAGLARASHAETGHGILVLALVLASGVGWTPVK